MAPRERKRKTGLMREDAARDRMRDYGFLERVINESIKELLGLYGEDQWFLIEDDSYAPLLAICLEKQEEINKQLAEVQTNQLAENQIDEMAEALNEEMAEEEQSNQLVEEEEEEEKEQEQDRHVEDGRDQADELSITNEAVTDPSPAAFHLGEASADYAPNSVEGAENRHCGWLSSEEEEEETNPKEDSDGDGDDDDEMIQLTPEPLCEELEELLREVRGQTKRKKETRWDK